MGPLSASMLSVLQREPKADLASPGFASTFTLKMRKPSTEVQGVLSDVTQLG